jgi:hypothetical protein
MAVVAVLALAVGAQERSTPQERPTKPAENRLVGISILDPGMKLLDTFGSPDEIQPLAIGGSGVGPGGGFAPGGGGGNDGGAGGGGGGGASATGINMLGDPFGSFNQRGGAGGGGGVPTAGGAAPGGGGGQGIGPAGAGGGGGGAASDTNRILYTRWVYKRGTSKYAFVVDKFNRVVQIEAIGLSDSRVGTSRGIRFGSTFSNVIKAYNVPDAYEISGDSIVIRYLVRDHVAFKLARLKAKEPHRVTGIVVAAGKL